MSFVRTQETQVVFRVCCNYLKVNSDNEGLHITIMKWKQESLDQLLFLREIKWINTAIIHEYNPE